MQTERVTFLTSREHKAALDAFAATSGKSMGHVLREAASWYVAQERAGEDEALGLIVDELERALPHMQADLEAMRSDIATARAAIADALERSAATTVHQDLAA